MKDLCDPVDLAALAKAGDLEAVERMTRCFGDKLMRVARKTCRTEAEAEDAVQDALVSAAEHLTDYRGEGRVDSWLSRMVVTACGRMRRGRKNDPAWHDAEAEPSGGDDPVRGAERLELASALRKAMGKLSPRDQALIILADVEGWKANEVADKLGMTHSAVRTRLSRARRKLREDLVGAGV